MNFVTIFPETENVHLVKDVGMIPYIMYKYFGYNSKIVCYKNNQNYEYLENEVKGLKIEFLEKKTGYAIKDGIMYLLKNSRKIDVLHLFHLSKRSLYWILVYKLLNPKGKVYLKLDANKNIKAFDYHKKSLKGYIKRKVLSSCLSSCNLISVETKHLYNYLRENWNLDVEYIPNGFYDNGKRQEVNYCEKENIILTVGRIGTYEKATEILLKGFKQASEKIPDWTLKIIGPIEKSFYEYIDNFFKENPQLKNKISFTGSISDREKLDAEYRKAKIFCLTSRWESFGLVLTEAIKNGCFLITSSVESALDLTKNGELGKIFDVDDYEQLGAILEQICNNQDLIEWSIKDIQDFAYENFYWPNICKKINDKLDMSIIR